MSRKDKRMLIVICVISSVLLSLILTEIRIRLSYKEYAIGAYHQAEETLNAVQALDSTYAIE